MTTVCAYPTPTPFAAMDSYFSRHANSAGLALPHIPRRASSSNTRSPARTPPAASTSPARSPLSTQVTFPSPTPASPAKVVVQPPTPPDAHQQPAQSLSQSSTAVASSSSSSTSTSTSGTSSGSGSDTYVEILAPKARRARVHQRGSIANMMCPPEQSTPTPAVLRIRTEKLASRVPFPSQAQETDDTPRPSTSNVLKPRPVSLRAVSASESHVLHPRSASVTIASIGRKKSGEPLKSSLKSRRPIVRGDLSVVTAALNSTKSEPNTPTHIKSVHFDAQLEHVKLFLAEQKPLAVSRDGSPTDDTSGTDSDFPAFIYGEKEEGRKEEGARRLEMHVQGLREESAAEREAADVKLESLQLAADGLSMVGRVRVRNIAFEKWVAVRFTCDWWQTTSEVTARYVESLPGGVFDRFQFSIRLNDMIGRINEKTMFLAVRYTSGGREMWDNNHSENYRMTFEWKRVAVSPSVRRVVDAVERAGKAANIADLKSKLEKVASEDENRGTVGGFLASRSRAHNMRASPPVSPPDSELYHDSDDEHFTLQSGTPLASRYDFAASLKNPWRRPSPIRAAFDADATPTANPRARTSTYPTSMPNFPRRSPEKGCAAAANVHGYNTNSHSKRVSMLTFGSPRIFDADDIDARTGIQSYYANSDMEEPDQEPSAHDSHDQGPPVPPSLARKGRNHQRGYFDMGMAAAGGMGVGMGASPVRRTPPGTPKEPAHKYTQPRSTSPPAYAASKSTMPMTMSGMPMMMAPVGKGVGMWRVASGGSEDSTPSSTSNEDSSRSSSPDRSPYEGPVRLAPEDVFPRSPSPGDEASYSVFLNRCVSPSFYHVWDMVY